MTNNTYVDFSLYKIVDRKDYYFLKRSGFNENGELLLTKNSKTGVIKYRISNEYYDLLSNIRKAKYSITKRQYYLLLNNSNKKQSFFKLNAIYNKLITYYVANEEAFKELKEISNKIYGE